MIAFCKFLGRANTREELFKLKGNVGTSTNGYELAMNKFKTEIKKRVHSHENNEVLKQPLHLASRSTNMFKGGI